MFEQLFKRNELRFKLHFSFISPPRKPIYKCHLVKKIKNDLLDTDFHLYHKDLIKVNPFVILKTRVEKVYALLYD